MSEKKKIFVVFISPFDVLNKRKVSSVLKGLSEIGEEEYGGYELWIPNDEAMYNVGGSYPLQTLGLRDRNIVCRLKQPSMFISEGELQRWIKETTEDRAGHNQEVRFLLIASDSRAFVKKVGTILYHEGAQYGIVDAFREDKKNYIRWEKKREKQERDNSGE